MDSIALKIGWAACEFSDTLTIGGLLGESCSSPMAFGYRFFFAFMLAFAVAWLLRPRMP